jgi:hypothetical protein
VSAIDPDIRGATTIRQQLAKHRQVETCAACHSKIDPAGFALESLDVIGQWRENYRSLGRGKELLVNGRLLPYRQGPAVESGDELSDGRRFDNIDQFKQLLLEDKDQLARALATQLATYAIGHPLDATDSLHIDTIVQNVKQKEYGLRTLVHEIVQSDLFRTR